jgi:hypothetical protein
LEKAEIGEGDIEADRVFRHRRLQIESQAELASGGPALECGFRHKADRLKP